MRDPKQKPGVPLDDVRYYLDAVERDRMEALGASRRTTEILSLREQMLKLPEDAYEQAMRAIRALVTEPRQDGRDERLEADARRRRLGTELLDRAAAARPGAGSTARAAQKVAPA